MARLFICVCLVFTATLANSLQSGLHNDMNNLSQEDKQAIALWWKDQVSRFSSKYFFKQVTNSY